MSEQNNGTDGTSTIDRSLEFSDNREFIAPRFIKIVSLKRRDMTEIYNINNVPDENIDDPQFESGLKTKLLGELVGSEKIYVNIDYIKPGKESVKYHSHSLQEEFFLILKGKGTLRLNGKSLPITQGDFFSKPAGKGIIHQFINNGDDVLEILDCGTPNKNDVITYPDEDVIFIKNIGMAFKRVTKIEGWSSEPNN